MRTKKKAKPAVGQFWRCRDTRGGERTVRLVKRASTDRMGRRADAWVAQPTTETRQVGRYTVQQQTVRLSTATLQKGWDLLDTRGEA